MRGAVVEEKPVGLRRPLSVASIVALLLCAFLWTAMFARIADRGIGVDKDLLYLYVCGLEIKEPSRHDQQLELIRQLVSISASEHLVYRATMRAGYCNNYPLTSLSMYAVGGLQRYFGVADPEKDFPKFISSSMWWGMTLSGAALGVLCLICVFWAARDALMLASFGAVTIAALLYMFVPPLNLSWMLHHAPPTRVVTLPNTLGLSLYSWLNPTAAFSPFSVFPRCLCAMLAFAAFTLRWSGRNGAAYWIPLIASFVHQSEAPILLAVMICCDLAIRPASLLRPASAVPIGLGVVVIALRERMFAIMGVPWFTAAIVFTAIACLAAAALMLPASRAAIKAHWSVVDGWRTRLFERFSVPFAETVIIIALWLVVLLICYAFRRDTFPRVVYFWSELPSRFVGLFQLSVITGLTYPAWLAIVRMRPRATREAMAVISCAAIVLAAYQWTRPWTSTTELINRARQTEELIAKGYPGEAGSYSRMETPWYYLILRRSFLGGEGLAEYFAKR